jgi:putative membrane protein
MPESSPTPQKVDDKKFLKQAAAGGLAEVELGKLAQQKASSDAVKQFGERMVTDHTKANDQLKEVASKENVAVPTTLDKKEQAHLDKLSKLSGPQFDKAYMKDQVKDHEKDVREFQEEAQNGTNPDIKQFASQTLPILQQHLDQAKSINKSAKTETASAK